MKNGIEKIEKNTEYTVFTQGKWSKFAFYGVKENGRLILLNTKYGTLTTMNASFFLKLIDNKHPHSSRPYKVEYPEDVSAPGKCSEKPVQAPVDSVIERNNAKEEEYDEQTKKWAFRLKTLPPDVSEKLEKEIGLAPLELGQRIEKWIEGKFEGRPYADILEPLHRAQGLLKYTEWYVK